MATNTKKIYCSVPDCRSLQNARTRCRSFPIPEDPDIAEQWLKCIGLKSLPPKKIFVCERHFQKHEIRETDDTLYKFSIPTLHMPQLQNATIDVKRDPSTSNRADVTDAPSNLENAKKIILSTSSSKVLQHVTSYIGLDICVSYPREYKMLRKYLGLPPSASLVKLFQNKIIGLENSLFQEVLKKKTLNLSDKDLNCVVCISEIAIQPNVYYDFKADHLIGLCDVGLNQKLRVANKALIVTLQGMYNKWQQPIGISYVNDCHIPNTETTNVISCWIEKIIDRLIDYGYKVRAIVSKIDANYYLKKEEPYFKIKDIKVFYMYDIESFLLSLYSNMVYYNYYYKGMEVQRQHIISYYELDRHKNVRLTPKLTEVHVMLKYHKRLTTRHVTDVIDYNTAAAMSTYIGFNALTPLAQGTVEFIKDMSTLYQILNTDNFDNRGLTESPGITQRTFLINMADNLKEFKFVPKSGKAPNVTDIIPKIQLTINAVIMLLPESGILSTRQLTLKNHLLFMDKISGKMKKWNNPRIMKNKTVHYAFRRLANFNILNLFKNKKTVDLNTVLNYISKMWTHDNIVKCAYKYADDEIQIRCCDYNMLEINGENSMILLAGFLLQKANDVHRDCEKMKEYVSSINQSDNAYSKSISEETQNGICVVPNEGFIEFVEMLEIKFRTYFSENNSDFQCKKIIRHLLNYMVTITFCQPCQCFPILYVKKLYLRFRIYHSLKYNATLQSYKLNNIFEINDL